MATTFSPFEVIQLTDQFLKIQVLSRKQKVVQHSFGAARIKTTAACGKGFVSAANLEPFFV